MRKRNAFMAVGLVFGLSLGNQLVASDTIGLGDLPLLFVDDSGVESRQTLVRTVHPAQRRDAPVVVADKPWEITRVYAWGSVHFDEATGKFQMWYLARVPIQKTDIGGAHQAESLPTNLLYATSRDGLHWEKPSLGLHSVLGSTENNIFDTGGGGSASVLFDSAEEDPSKRYKMMAHRHGGYHALYSADGIHWEPYPKNPVLSEGDTVMIARDPTTGEYLAYHKRPAKVRGFPRRVVWLARSDDFQNWSEPKLVFVPDSADDDWLRGPNDRTEVYDMPVFPHAAGFVGFPAIFQHMPQEFDGSKTAGGGVVSKAGGASTATGPIDIQLATSHDGEDWQRSYPRIAIIPRGAPGTYDGGSILNTAAAPVTVDEETWVYYTAINTGHGAPIPPKEISIGRADWRRYGFVSLDAGPEGGELLTKPLEFESPTLLVNADSSRGELRVALLEVDQTPIDGYSFEDSEVLTDDATAWTARWKEQTAIPTDRPVHVAIRMHNTRLFSLESRQGSRE